MKLSLSWIRDYVNLPENISLKQLAYDLTMSTVEVEGITNLADDYANMVIGYIQEVLPHPNADKLRICRVDVGHEVKEIVCGGVNLAPEMKVAVALPGAKVRWHGSGEPVEIKAAKLRGAESYGMICASSEIGMADLFPAAQEAEIMDLSALDCPAGTSLADALDLNDAILEIDNKSMTNRPDLWGHYGMARELAALYDLPLKPITPFKTDIVSDFQMEILDAERCRRCIGVKMQGVYVKPAPYLVQNRLWKVGQRPINALVDITNYVMLATGQPNHAYDADQIVGHIRVRRASGGEVLNLLNGKALQLSTDDLVISDDVEPVGLAGIMGGSKDSILPDTQRVILEIANFEAIGIRRTALRYDNRTEASSRYEKAIDPERCDLALALSMEMFRELYPELRVTGFVDNYPRKLKRAEVDLRLSWLERRLGMAIPEAKIRQKMESLGFEIQIHGDHLHVVAPSWRSTGDISIPADIMEEVARMYGYENFQPSYITTTFEGAINQLDKDLVRRIKEYLAIRCGMQEVFTYPWVSEKYINAVCQTTEHILQLSTPPSPEERFIRPSLLPGLCAVIEKNEHSFPRFAVFEEAQVFSDQNYTSPYDPSEKLPSQRRHIAGVFAEDNPDIQELFRRVRGVLEAMPRYTHMQVLTFCQKQKPAWADTVVWLNIFSGEQKVGDLGLLTKKASIDCGIKKHTAILFELDTDALMPLRSRTNTFTRLPEYPMVENDLSLLLDASVRWEDILSTISDPNAFDGLVKKITFIDEYRGRQIPAGKKSLTLRLTIGSAERTLKLEEAESCTKAVVRRLNKAFGATLRG